jgi:hypothetical protein
MGNRNGHPLSMFGPRTALMALLITGGVAAVGRTRGPASPADAAGVGKASQAEAYGYRYLATTGICDVVLEQGKERAILFHPQSDRLALRSLRALKAGVLLPSADEGRLYLVGRLLPGVKHTPKGRFLPGSEPYQEFILHQWYLATPFHEQPLSSDGVSLRRTTIRRDRLRREDFDPFPGREKLDLRRYIRTRRR